MCRNFAMFSAEFLLLFVTIINASPLRLDSLENFTEQNNTEHNITFNDKSFNKYTQELLHKYNDKNYFAAIYEDDKARDDFTKFLNEGLTQQAKDDLSGLRIYRKVGNVEIPMVMFAPQMDSWLGILPQWKRTKRYIFKKIEEYLTLHPEVLNRPLRPSRFNFNDVKS